MSTAVARPFEVYKFGGSSVATADRIRNVVRLVRDEPDSVRRVVVVSALGGVTDELIRAIDAALTRSGKHTDIIAALRNRHQTVLDDLAGPADWASVQGQLAKRWEELSELLDGVSLLRECTPRTRDLIIGTGERLSAPLIAAAFRSAGEAAMHLEATEVIRTDDAFGEAGVQFDETNELVRWRFQNLPQNQITVVTGFIASTERGVLTTLGRSGSDYTATILGGALQAKRVVIWTDVDGVLSADPRIVPDAFPLPQLSYQEAGEMAYFGAKVLHPRTMRPLQTGQIPLTIKNTLNPSADGTLITQESAATGASVKAVSAIRNVAVVMLEGAGMIGVPGISARTFGALAGKQINVLMISQASSEQSICIVVAQSDAEAAVGALEKAFAYELSLGDVSRIYAVLDTAILSIVGDQMRLQPGLAGRMFATLGSAGINVLAIAQGASERNISAVLHDDDVTQAVRALHATFAQAHHRVHLFLIGHGLVGQRLLEILGEVADPLLEHDDLQLRLVGIANSRRGLFSTTALPFTGAVDLLGEATSDPDEALEAFATSHFERRIIVDATASAKVAARYTDWLGQGIAVVTPNKRANTMDLDYYDALHNTPTPYFYETTVGAGLPVLRTLDDLVASGDRVHRIDGVLSGTLAFVFSRLMAGDAFSEAVRAAREQGFTEPDPRDDLQGEDVARKLLILARTSGLRAERAEVEVESLVPQDLATGSVDAFMDGLAAHDAAWADKVEAAKADGKRLCYLGRVEGTMLRVGVEAVGPDAMAYHLRGTDNLVAFTTDRYPASNPLTILGAGAGPDVTAAGVLVDILRAARGL